MGDLAGPEDAHALSSIPQFQTALSPHSRAHRVWLRAREARSLDDIQQVMSPKPDEAGKRADGILDLVPELRKWPVRELISHWDFENFPLGSLHDTAFRLTQLVIATRDPETVSAWAESVAITALYTPAPPGTPLDAPPTPAELAMWSPTHRLPVEYLAKALLGISVTTHKFSATEFPGRYREHLAAWNYLARWSPDEVRPHLMTIRRVDERFQDPWNFEGRGLKLMPPPFWQETKARIDALFELVGPAGSLASDR